MIFIKLTQISMLQFLKTFFQLRNLICSFYKFLIKNQMEINYIEDFETLETILPNSLILGDCLEVMKKIESKSVQLIFSDLPYGSTSCAWDIIIAFEPLWDEYKRVLKDNGTIALTASQPFTSLLVMSNIEMFKYDWIWKKNKTTGFVFAKTQPLRDYESVLIFQKQKYSKNSHEFLRNYFKIVQDFIGLKTKQINQMMGNRFAEHCFYIESEQFNLPDENTYKKLTELFNLETMPNYISYENLKKYDFIYNPQGLIKKKVAVTKNKKASATDWVYSQKSLTGKDYLVEYENYPRQILEFNCEGGLHPTQKPVALPEYMIKTYTNEGDLVLDNCIGSGTTAIACINTNRTVIGIEKELKFYNISKNRIKNHIANQTNNIF